MIGLLLGGAAFLLYLAGGTAGVDWMDSGELTAAAWSLGVSHPPGQALYSLLGRLFACLPFGEIAFRLNLLSAVAGGLAVAGTVRLAERLVGGRVGPAAAGGVVALSPVLVGQATRAEVYAPAAAVLVWTAVAVVAYLRPRPAGAAGGPLTAAFALALATGIQPLLAAAVALPFCVAIVLADPRRAVRLLPVATALGILGVIVHLGLYVRAIAPDRPLLLWDDPSSARRLLDVLRARAYSGNFALAGLGERLAGHAALLGEGPGLAALLGGAAGLGFGAITRLRGAGTLLVAAAVVVVATSSQRVFLPDNPDIHGYLLAGLPLLAAGLAVAVAGVTRVFAHPAAAFLALGPIVLLAAAGPHRHVLHAWRMSDDTLRFHDATVGSMPPGPAVYLSQSDHALFTSIYERLCAGARPDVGLADDTLVTSSWHLDMLKREVPELFVPYLDDGGRKDRLAARLAEGNPTRREHPLTLTFTPNGEVGRRIVAEAAYRRALTDLGKDNLIGELPDVTPVFIHARWQDTLVEENRAIVAGQPAGPGYASPPELRLLHAWHRLLVGGDESELEPRDRTATARMLLHRGREAEAIRLLEAALPDEGAGLLLAAIHGNAGRLADAEALLSDVLAKHPKSARALADRGLVRAKLGRVAEAEADWRASLAIDPTQRDVAAYLRAASRP